MSRLPAASCPACLEPLGKPTPCADCSAGHHAACLEADRCPPCLGRAQRHANRPALAGLAVALAVFLLFSLVPGAGWPRWLPWLVIGLSGVVVSTGVEIWQRPGGRP